jgi:hypothetical protein
VEAMEEFSKDVQLRMEAVGNECEVRLSETQHLYQEM